MTVRKAGCLWSLIKLVVLVCAIAFGVAYFFGSHMFSGTVKAFGMRSGVSMGVGAVSFDIPAQRLDIKDFYIRNPGGYSDENAFDAKLVSLAFKTTLGALDGSGPVVIDKISISEPSVFLELLMVSTLENLGDKTNLGLISQRFAPASEGAPLSAPSGPEPRRFILKELYIDKGALKFGVFNKSPTATLILEPIRIKDIGLAENGITMGQMLARITSAVLDAAAQSAHATAPNNAE